MEPLKSVMVLGSPPTRPVEVLSAGPGNWKWMSGPPSRWKSGTAPGMGMGETLGRLRSSSASRDKLCPPRRGQAHRGRTRRGGGADFRESSKEGNHIVALL